jgi:serine protein kinase
MGSVRSWLDDRSREEERAFRENHRIKSFEEFLGDLEEAPYALSRNAVQYVVDMMEFFGTKETKELGEPVTRFCLFDAPFGRSADQPLVGQEGAVREIHEALKNLVLEGRADRILHLHGPNGSAKSLIVELLMRGCEEYSHRPEGTLFSFNWVFPSAEGEPTLGFRESEGRSPSGPAAGDSFAHLPSDRLEARIPCDLGDSPLLLVPPAQRLPLLRRFLDGRAPEEKARFVATHLIQDGDLCPRCRQIYDALLDEYEGDLKAVLRHVQVQRRYLSRRYRRGAVVISPQETPDAASRQLTLDSSLAALPRALQHLNITQVYGDLVDANNGLVEFSDFLTRSPELNKYLLSATERGELVLSSANIYLNLVLFATSNELHLDAFKQSPDFASFKGRSILVAIPYLLERTKEAAIYGPILERIGRFRHVAPHTGTAAALWAVLTRLNRPDPDRYPQEVRELVGRLAPYAKALLYDGALPLHDGAYTPRELREVRSLLPALREEFRDTPIFEGRFGASPREMREILYNAAYHRGSACVTPPVLFEEILSFIKDKSLYLFLQLKVDEGYHDAESAVEWVKQEYLEKLDEEVLAAMELAPEGQYSELFGRYFRHVRAFLRGEKVRSATTGQWEEPSAPLLSKVEEYLGVTDSPQRFREDLLRQVAAWTLENPAESLDLNLVFAPQIQALARGFHSRVVAQVSEIGAAVLAHGTPAFDALPEARRKAAERTLAGLVQRYGYCPRCAPQCVAYLMRHRYSDA